MKWWLPAWLSFGRNAALSMASGTPILAGRAVTGSPQARSTPDRLEGQSDGVRGRSVISYDRSVFNHPHPHHHVQQIQCAPCRFRPRRRLSASGRPNIRGYLRQYGHFYNCRSRRGSCANGHAISPPHMLNDFFSLFALSGTATSFAGPLAIGVVTSILNGQRVGVSVVILFFIVGYLLLIRVHEAGCPRRRPRPHDF
jgi:Vacuole effluxer Atg22 like